MARSLTGFVCLAAFIALLLPACSGGGGTSNCAESCSNGTCVGSVCVCDDGYALDETGACADVDECAAGTADCGAAGTCENTEGAYTCTCEDGYEWAGDDCADVNECLVNHGGCDEHASCENSEGSFSCTCDDGFSGDGTTCTDVDECETGASECLELAICVNTEGSYTCECEAGYAGDGVTGCYDIDECLEGIADCLDEAVCTNTAGGFSCDCPAGYTGDGVTACDDVDECAEETDACLDLASCENTAGGYTCTCADGYIGDGVTGCYDIDECLDGSAGCLDEAVCTNTAGGFSCDCPAGYTGDGVTACDDVDECAAETDACLDLASCENTAGGYTCTCADGYAGDGINACDDIDECAAGTDDCHANAVCTNEMGGFSCACAAGYAGDGVDACDDIDECAEGTYTCPPNGLCENTAGSYDCVCKAGYDLVDDQCERDCSVYQVDFDTHMAASDGFEKDGFIVNGSDLVVSNAATGLGVVGGDSDNLLEDGEWLRFDLPVPASRITFRIGSENCLDGCTLVPVFVDADGNTIESLIYYSEFNPEWSFVYYLDTPAVSFDLQMNTYGMPGGYSIDQVTVQGMEFHSIDFREIATGTAADYTDPSGILTVTSAPRDLNFLFFNGLGVVGGLNDTTIDTDESITMDFTAPVSAFVYRPASGGGAEDSLWEVFDADGADLGTFTVTSQLLFDGVDVFGILGITEFSSVTVHANETGTGNTNHRLGELGFGICR